MEMLPPPSPSLSRKQHRRPPSTAMMRPSPRNSSRLSMTSKHEGTTTVSKASDEECKTAVKVAIRVRPPLRPEDPGYDLIPQRFRTSTVEVISSTNLAIQSNQGRKLFVFDRVFGEEVEQKGVWDYVSDSVTSFIQGYNVSILAYGQSGAGKSYTMGTSALEEQGDSEIKGVVPRAAEALFAHLTGSKTPKSGMRTPQRYSSHGLPTLQSLNRQSQISDQSWTLKATYVEIYNEQLRDLLVPDTVPHHERAQVSIREDTKGRILLTGLTQVEVNSVDDLLAALNFGSSIRQTDATAINAMSSRSHAVFSLNLVQRKSGDAETSRQHNRNSMSLDSMTSDSYITTDSKLHFVDLAGSERLKNTGAQGERAKEGISINAGLASLGKVISQLSSKQSGGHVSYRDSRLTRLLQDSLGGNAITYMIACVTQAEFHLSETLNTVHYAQRARAIQSKPEIQQTSEDKDHSARIERLQAEVAFLREQVQRERDQRPVESSERPSHRKATELQNQLMDMQESYNALSQRHTKLISELGKTRDNPSADTPMLQQAIGGSAVERLQRSSSFAEAVEAVVLEYEKTIQSLEGTLLNTRSSLSNSESTLMERENKIAYMETVSQQLQQRLQNLAEREANNDMYLRELESQLEGANSDEEDKSLLVKGLRAELTRVKDNQSSSEDYISTLEERLAEAEQDHDTLKRELERMEQVIERQRSIARLDNMLADMDEIRKVESNDTYVQRNAHRNAALQNLEDPFHQGDASPPSPLGAEAVGLGINHHNNGHASPVSPLVEEDIVGTPRPTVQGTARKPINGLGIDTQGHQAMQLKFMADKLETLTQELFDLRGEHEYTVGNHEELQQKYSVALQTLARLQDTDDDKTNPTDSNPFLGQERAATGNAGRPTLSRSLSSEYSSQPPSTSSSQHSIPRINTSGDSELANDHAIGASQLSFPQDTPVEQSNSFRRARSESHAGFRELSAKHAQLLDTHQEALIQIERLKAEKQRLNLESPSPSRKSPLLRRKPSLDASTAMGNVDRANRSFASLRNIALDHFETNIDVRQNFEIQLNTIMSELHGRSEKVQETEAELATLRHQVDDKARIIAGLTKERSTFKAASNVDFSVVGQMQDQLIESEHQIRSLHEEFASREAALQDELEQLKSQLPHRVDHSQANVGADADGSLYTNDEVSHLREELSHWQLKHADTTRSMQASESRLLATIASLQNSLESGTQRSVSMYSGDGVDYGSVPGLEAERAKHNEVVLAMQREIDDHKAAGQKHSKRLAVLEKTHADILRQVDEDNQGRHLTDQELRSHRELVVNLESQLQAHQSASKAHENSLATLRESHANKTKELQAISAAAEKNSNQRYAALQRQHNDAVAELESELKSHYEGMTELLAGAAAALGHETDETRLRGHIQAVTIAKRDLEAKHTRATNDKKVMDNELVAALASNAELQHKIDELKQLHDEALTNLDKVVKREAKSSRLVQELEDQLNSNYDHNQASTHRLSAMQSEKQIQLQEALHARTELEKEVEDSRMRINLLESHIADMRRRSGTPTTRESAGFNRDSLSPEAATLALGRSNSASSNQTTTRGPTVGTTALPSPPPAIPLPPLPGALAHHLQNGASSIDARAVSPVPQSRPSSGQHHYAANSNAMPTENEKAAQHLAQVVDEQESRIRTVEKHLFAEKQLTATLEEALVDLETAQNKTRSEVDGWRKRAQGLEDEIVGLRRERDGERANMAAIEEEREMRIRSEQARMALESRMRELNAGKKKKKGGLNCF